MARLRELELTGWGRTIRATAEVARPERRSALEALMAEAPAPAMGRLRSYGDAALNDGGLAVDMTRLDRMLGLDEDTGILTVEAGARIGEINAHLAPRGWLVPVMPGTGFATVGGAIAMDVHGKNHHGAGAFGQHVTRMTLLTPANGAIEVTPETGAVFRATLGGLGQTGIIAEAAIRLKRAKGEVMMVTERRVADWDEHLALLDASEATYTVGWIDATATGAALGRGILEEAETGAGLVPPAKRGKRVPLDAPAFALSPGVVKTFNAAYWRRVPVRGRTVVKPIEDFFFPLDKLHDWNRLYGKAGFHQFQCVVPLEAAGQLREMLVAVAKSAMASPLAVLKRMGPGRAGMMSFPMEGYTLAVDLHAAHRPGALVQRLEAMARDAGGRIYLAKDSLGQGESVRAMYPEWQDWAEEVARHDPEGRMATDLVRRLGLRDLT
ncbi:FAD-binding oxidoreductase [Ovoidimarina sediminis]|uniref:FAD-binding oxidoreductase n=1 Tax=Ovoidimarina sediminis TaxID=3079856 RepID=UPI00290D5EA4|nr:FAD-binding oxidoreductase [Rhodophyticola sp. MJ-SS7]MDU8942944.1 FAD-binding oxidoreductase [Rhodophyticola sp. MJ-SS7]